MGWVVFFLRKGKCQREKYMELSGKTKWCVFREMNDFTTETNHWFSLTTSLQGTNGYECSNAVRVFFYVNQLVIKMFFISPGIYKINQFFSFIG